MPYRALQLGTLDEPLTRSSAQPGGSSLLKHCGLLGGQPHVPLQLPCEFSSKNALHQLQQCLHFQDYVMVVQQSLLTPFTALCTLISRLSGVMPPKCPRYQPTAGCFASSNEQPSQLPFFRIVVRRSTVTKSWATQRRPIALNLWMSLTYFALCHVGTCIHLGCTQNII